VPFPELPGLLRRWELDLALLPINGRDSQRGVPGNFTGPEAARLAHAIGARQVIPMHYDMFAFNTVSPAEFEREAQRLGQPYRILLNGERYTLAS
jgi:L-ascorbate metabolism protein UlaG (beta-lactamase superfamily)